MTFDTSAPSPPSGIAGAVERLKSARREVQLAAEEINDHVKQHEAKVAAHTAEIVAARKLISEFMPGVDKKAAEAAAFVLTSPTWTQGLIRFMGRNWRIVAFAACAFTVWKLLF